MVKHLWLLRAYFILIIIFSISTQVMGVPSDACRLKLNCNSSPVWLYNGKTPTDDNIYICVNGTVNFSVSTDANDYDTCVDDSQTCLDGPIQYAWTGVPDTGTSSASGTWETGGVYTVTCEMSDPGNIVLDKTETATWNVYVIQVKLMYEGNDITGQTVETIVSKAQGLTAEVIPSEVTPESYQWSVAGKKIKDYIHDDTPFNTCEGKVKVHEASDLQKKDVSFFWVDGGSKGVSCQVKINDELTCSGSATFTVLRPTASISTVTGAVALNHTNHVFGYLGISGYTPYGITFTRASFTEPPNWTGGTTKWVQVVNSTTRDLENSSGILYRFSGSNLLDTAYPFPVGTDTTTHDSPNSLYQGYVRLSANDSYTMYLMYLWDGNGVDVPLRKVDWNWNGSCHLDTTLSPPDFVLDSGSDSAGADTDTTDHPTWLGNVKGLSGVAQVVITTTSLPDGTVNQPYNQTLTSSGGKAPLTWTIISGSLPPGLSLGSDGVISGTPTTPGTYTFTVQVTDSSIPPFTSTTVLTIIIS